MIRSTFQILDRVGELREHSIWKQGIRDWDDFIERDRIKGISAGKKPYLDRQLRKAKRALYNMDSSYFYDKLGMKDTWRLYDFFREEAVFLDIEAEGVNPHSDITVIGLFDGISTKTMVKGVNMEYSSLRKELSRYKVIVTFNGSSFDLPFIRKRYDILPDIPHIDLRHLCSRLGLSGGLKNIEKGFGISRNKIIEHMYGGDALMLWKMFKATGDRHYLNLLVEYNEEDVLSLKKIMNYCYDKLSGEMKNEIAAE
ncbi:hypothetical protein GF323_04920 [Candidatus Woesearchaeota archaeon]|nr:hypothetical protein [Candidatus Woesearchaeota archaeon]